MTVVIQCASSKAKDAGSFRTSDGRRVAFVADPDTAPAAADCIHVRPDDPSDDVSFTWRQRADQYNRLEASANPLRLKRAVDLYRNRAYRNVLRAIGAQNLFILSAGWGLIAADFLTPDYDITFKPGTGYRRRRPGDAYQDFQHLVSPSSPVLFCGGLDYVPFFCELTSELPAERVVLHQSGVAPDAPGCRLVHYPTRRRTNWQYECAVAVAEGRFRL